MVLKKNSVAISLMLLPQFDWTNISIRNQEPLNHNKNQKNVGVKTTHQYININLVKILV